MLLLPRRPTSFVLAEALEREAHKRAIVAVMALNSPAQRHSQAAPQHLS